MKIQLAPSGVSFGRVMHRYRFLADMSDLRSIHGPEAPDVLIVGGFAVPEESVPALLSGIFETKARITGNGDMPVKWNFKDLEWALAAQDLQEKKDLLLAAADPLRAELLQLLRTHGCTLFVSAIQAYSNRKQVLGKTRPELVRFSFTNLLQRFGLFAKGHASPGGRIHLDWPEKNQPQPFTVEYLAAWRTGSGFMCGPLRALGFEPALSFGITDVDPLLQLADLVVGTSRNFVKYAQSSCAATDFGVQQFRACLPSFYADPAGEIRGWGFVISPKDSGFAELIRDAAAKLRGSTN